MSNRRSIIVSLMTTAVLAFGFLTAYGNAHADVLQPVFGTADTTQGNGWGLQIGTGYTGTVTGAYLFFFASTTALSGPNLDVIQYSSSGYTGQVGECDFGASLSTGVYPANPYSLGTGVAVSGYGCTLYPSSYVSIFTQSTASGSDVFTFYGSSSPVPGITATVTPGGAVLVPYFQIQGVFGGSGPNAINWQSISPPPLFTLGTTSSAIAASSSLWASLTVASSSISCDSGNIFSDGLCAALSYLLLPAPSIFQSYADLPQTESAHWPFSWLYQVQTVVDAQSATQGNFQSYSLNLTAAASSTMLQTSAFGNFMPSFTFFSSTTVMKFLPQTSWDFLQSLLAVALVLGFVADVFFTIRDRFHRV